jgi:hypothetical protein
VDFDIKKWEISRLSQCKIMYYLSATSGVARRVVYIPILYFPSASLEGFLHPAHIVICAVVESIFVIKRGNFPSLV